MCALELPGTSIKDHEYTSETRLAVDYTEFPDRCFEGDAELVRHLANALAVGMDSGPHTPPPRNRAYGFL